MAACADSSSSMGTTMPGSTIGSVRNSTGRSRGVVTVRSLQELSDTYSTRRCFVLFHLVSRVHRQRSDGRRAGHRPPGRDGGAGRVDTRSGQWECEAPGRTQDQLKGASAMSTLAAGVFVDWEELTGQSKLVVELVSFPIFSALAGLLTNWTGVLMLFWPLEFRGVRIPGLHVLYPYLPRRVQVLPTFSGDGRQLGFQGFIPARAEKMASICVDKALMRIGSPRDFIHELDLDGVADHIAATARSRTPEIVDEVMYRENPDLWKAVPRGVRQAIYQRVDAQLPKLCRRAFDSLGDNIDQLIDI